MKMMIVGLGYVGSVTSACFASVGHHVVGVDISPIKVEQIRSAVPPVHEPGLKQLTIDAVERGLLTATTDMESAWPGSDVIVVSVGTPTGPSGDVHLEAVQAVTAQLGDLLANEAAFKVIVITSTVPPGTLRAEIQPMLEERSGKKAGVDFGLAFSPEFLREGTAVDDFLKPEKVIIGADDKRSLETLRALFKPFHSAPIETSPEIAESVKFAANAWHALKVAFANEIGRTCAANGVDSHAVMEIFKSDKKLNISDRYLTPGFAFGGSCLPKDVRTLTYRARSQGVKIPVLESLLPSNEEHLAYALREIVRIAPKQVLVLGLAFKANTDDLRESPAVNMVEYLLGRGYSVRVHDEFIQPDLLVGGNRNYMESRLPHLLQLLVTDVETEISRAEIVIVAQPNLKFNALLEGLDESQIVLDLTGTARRATTRAQYRGLAW